MQRIDLSLVNGLTFLLVFLVSGCSSNSVTIHDNGKQPYDQQTRQFSNLYIGEKDYPLTCRDDCYAPREELTCREGVCQYQGNYSAAQYEGAFIVQWFGHAQFVVVTPSGERFLIDPVFEEFDWPINWLHAWFNGDYRSHYPQFNQDNRQATDAVLYSHVHYDHFNKSDIKSLGSNKEYFVPLNVAPHIPAMGASVNEMGWFSSKAYKNTEVVALPAHHFSSRTFIPFIYDDSNRTSWNGWLLKSAGKTLFFAGDTGYSKHFSDIFKQYGAIDVCLMPIASYHSDDHPKWYRYVHMTPEDAVTAAKDLRCKVIIPWGYGNASWGMGDKSSHAPLLRFLAMLEQTEVQTKVVILDEKSHNHK